jgi:ribosomal-protein-alanine N-acetyltransferase
MTSFIQIDAETQESFIAQVQQLQQSSFSPCWSSEQVRQHLNNPRSKSFALIDKRASFQSNAATPSLIGYVFYQCLFDCAELLQIAIHRDYRNKGFAASLIEQSTCLLNQSTIEYVQLEVRESNTHAIKLYKSLGFALDGIRKNYYPAIDGSKLREHAHLYSKACTDSQSSSAGD